MKEYIEKYINRNYKITVTGEWFYVMEIKSETIYNINDFAEIIEMIFGRGAVSVATEWYEAQKVIMCADIERFFKSLRVWLGPRNWVLLTPLNEEMSRETFCVTFKDKYPDSFLNKYWHDSTTKLIENATHKIMGITD